MVSKTVLRCCLVVKLPLARLGACSPPLGFIVWGCLLSLVMPSLVVRSCPSWWLAGLRRGLVLGDVLPSVVVRSCPSLMAGCSTQGSGFSPHVPRFLCGCAALYSKLVSALCIPFAVLALLI